jgi:hypothetical protein
MRFSNSCHASGKPKRRSNITAFYRNLLPSSKTDTQCRHSERPNDEVYAIPLISTRRIEDKVLINNVYDNELLQNGIARGQEIVEIDGIPVEQYAEQRVKP